MTAPAPTDASQHLPAWMISSMPGLFVVLWSTGFIGGKYGLPFAEPFTFLLIRFLFASLLLGILAVAFRAPWPTSWSAAGRIALAGIMVHALCLGGVFAAIHRGVPVGVASLIVGVQPILTAVAAGPFLGEKVTRRQWAGFLLGLMGVALVVSNKLSFAPKDIEGIGWALLGLVGITVGTLYQKRHGGGMDLRTGSIIQFMASAVVMAIMAWATETREVQWTGEFIFATGWLVIVLSIGAVSLLMILIRRGAASKVASLFYLVPPVTALMAFFLFGETLGWGALLGMAAAMAGVAIVIRS